MAKFVRIAVENTIFQINPDRVLMLRAAVDNGGSTRIIFTDDLSVTVPYAIDEVAAALSKG